MKLKFKQPQKKRKIVWGHSKLCPWKISISGRPGKKYWTQDSDKDGVIDGFDCAPHNKKKQGPQHQMMRENPELKYNNAKYLFERAFVFSDKNASPAYLERVEQEYKTASDEWEQEQERQMAKSERIRGIG